MSSFSIQIVTVLLRISESPFEVTNTAGFKSAKLILYLFQLFGYVYSQYEAKQLTTQELNYVAQYTQLSSGTFILNNLAIDSLTIGFFYFLFCLHLSLYICIFILSRMSIRSQVVFQILNFILLNFCWIFVTPFQELAISVIVCGKNAFIVSQQKNANCYDQIPVLQTLIGVIGTLLVSFTGFINVYFFRCYQFGQVNFQRKFGYMVYVRILMHQLLIISYYLNLSSLDYIKHTLMHLLLVELTIDALTKFPFGFGPDARLFTAAIAGSEYIMIVISVWLFSSVNSEMMFFSIITFLPLIVVVSLTLNDYQRIKLYQQFSPLKYNINADVYLEEMYVNGLRNYEDVHSRVNLIQILNSHCQGCKFPICPCKQNPQTFLNSANQLDFTIFNNFVAFIFNQVLQVSLTKFELQTYETQALKYATFLEQFKNNATLSYGILQDIRYNQANFNSLHRRRVFSVSYYFNNIVHVIQARNVKLIEDQNQRNSSLFLSETILFRDVVSIIQRGEQMRRIIFELVENELDFWSKYIDDQIDNFDILMEKLLQIVRIKLLCEQKYKVIKSVIADDQHVSQLNIRLQIIYHVCVIKDYFKVRDLERKHQMILQLENIDINSIFKAANLYNNSMISILGQISPQNKGKLALKLNDKQKDFFGVGEFTEEIEFIGQLMPQFTSQFHNFLIDTFLQQGHSKIINGYRRVFTYNQNGFIEQVVISFGNFFQLQSDDYVFLLVAHIKKLKKPEVYADLQNGVILLNDRFQIVGYNQIIQSALTTSLQEQINPLIIQEYYNIFQFLPDLREQLIQIYESKLEQKRLLTSQELYAGETDFFISPSMKYGKQQVRIDEPLSVAERIKLLKYSYTQNSMKFKEPVQFYVKYVVEQVINNILQDGVPKQIIHYQLFFNQTSSQEDQIISVKISNNYLMSSDQKSFDSMDLPARSDKLFSISANEVMEFDPVNQASVTSYSSTKSSITQVQEFQNLIMNKGYPKVFERNLIAHSVYLFMYILFIMLIGLLDSAGGIEISCQNKYLPQFQEYRLFQQFVLLDLRILHDLSQKSSSLIQDQYQILINAWNNQSQLNTLTTQDIKFLVRVQPQNTSQIYQEQMDIVTFNNLLYSIIQAGNYQGSSFFILNYLSYLGYIEQIFATCQSTSSSTSAFQLFLIYGYPFFCINIILMFTFNFKILQKYGQIMKIFVLTQYEQIFKEMEILNRYRKLISDHNVWLNDRSLDRFIYNQSQTYVASEDSDTIFKMRSKIINNSCKQILKKQGGKLKVGPPISTNMGLTKHIIIYSFLLTFILMYLIVVQISTFLLSQTQDDYKQSNLQLMQTELRLYDIISAWQCKVYKGNISFNYLQQETGLQNFQQTDFQNMLTTLSLATLNEVVCKTLNCSIIINQMKRPQQFDYNISLLTQMSQAINLITQSQLFIDQSFNVDELLRNEYYQQYYVWGYDIFQFQISTLFTNVIQTNIDSIQQQYSNNLVVIILIGIIILLVNAGVIIYILMKGQLVYGQLKKSLLFMPFSVQMKPNVLHLLKVMAK